jgi:hypothetical protein
MSVAASLGPQSLVQLGLSLSDVALVLNAGRKLGNWLFAPHHDRDLFEYLMEDTEALLRRRGIVDLNKMESLYAGERFIFNGREVDSAEQNVNAQKHGDLNAFSWLMAVIVGALDICLHPQSIKDLIIAVFVKALGNEEVTAPLRVNLDVNIESWRQVGTVRNLSRRVQASFRRTWAEKASLEAIPQLNQAEMRELTEMLFVLFSDELHSFNCVSVATFSIARAIQDAGIAICTAGNASFDGQLVIRYRSSSVTSLDHRLDFTDEIGAWTEPTTRALMVAYPAGKPKSMIHAIEADRKTTNEMEMM